MNGCMPQIAALDLVWLARPSQLRPGRLEGKGRSSGDIVSYPAPTSANMADAAEGSLGTIIIIGASLSEPHTYVKYATAVCMCIYIYIYMYLLHDEAIHQRREVCYIKSNAHFGVH